MLVPLARDQATSQTQIRQVLRLRIYMGKLHSTSYKDSHIYYQDFLHSTWESTQRPSDYLKTPDMVDLQIKVNSR